MARRMLMHLSTIAAMVVWTAAIGGCSDDDDGHDQQDSAVALDAGLDAGMDAGEPDADTRVLVMPEFDMTAVMADLEYLSADDTGGRAPATAGNEAALAYVEARFAEIGLESAGDEPGSYRQEFPYTKYEHLSPPSVSVDGTHLVSGQDYTVAWFSGSGLVSGEVVYVGYGTAVPPYDAAQWPNCWADPVLGYDDYAGLDVTGKIIVAQLVSPDPDCPFEFGLDRREGARSRGAVGILSFQPTIYPTWYPLRGLSLPASEMNTGLPWLHLAYDRLLDFMPDLPDRLYAFAQTHQPQSVALGMDATIDLDTRSVETVSHNLLGRITGNDPTIGHEVVIVSGHIDHLGTDEETGAVYNGTNDNTSGTVGAYRVVEQILQQIGTPRRTLLVAAWNAEERGLIGSCYYVDNPLHTLADTAAMVNLEHMVQGDGAQLAVLGLNDPTSLWLPQLLNASLAYFQLPTAASAFPVSDSSDHFCFHSAGIAATTVLQGPFGVFDYYHSVHDEFDRVDSEEYRKGLEGVYSMVAVLALGLEDLMVQSAAPPPSSMPMVAAPPLEPFDLFRSGAKIR